MRGGGGGCSIPANVLSEGSQVETKLRLKRRLSFHLLLRWKLQRNKNPYPLGYGFLVFFWIITNIRQSLETFGLRKCFLKSIGLYGISYGFLVV